MPGFDAIGKLALGQLPGTGITAVFLTGMITSSAQSKVSFSGTGILAGRIAGQAKVRAPTVPVGILSARSKSMVAARAPGGFGLSGRISAAAKMKSPGGYALYARMALMSSAMSSIHLEGTLTPTRLPLLLNSGSQYGASYWKGRD